MLLIKLWRRRSFSCRGTKLLNFNVLFRIAEHEKKLIEAVWQALHGAWVCDDACNSQGAIQSRLRVAQLIEDSCLANLEFSEQRGLDRCVQADALRRAGEFQRAKELLQHMQ
ncbi:unnamed protein product, partial [Rotaria sp. Silwood2]